jgi:hypothetical protein
MASGKRLWRSVVAGVDADVTLQPRDLEVLGEACAMQDTISALERAVKRDGEVLAGGDRDPRVNPAVVELRQARVAKMRLLAAVSTQGEAMRSPTSRRAQKAADARWSHQRELAARRREMQVSPLRVLRDDSGKRLRAV